jgi:hypothetical protein
MSITAFLERGARDLDSSSQLELSRSRKLRCSQQSKALRLRGLVTVPEFVDLPGRLRHEAIFTAKSRRLWTAVSITAFL